MYSLPNSPEEQGTSLLTPLMTFLGQPQKLSVATYDNLWSCHLAARALAQAGEMSIPQLLNMLRMPSYAQDETQPGQRTKALATQQEAVRYQVANALVKIGPGAVPGLLGAAKDRDMQVRTAALRTLGRIGDPRIVPLFIETLLGPDRASMPYAHTTLIVQVDRWMDLSFLNLYTIIFLTLGYPVVCVRRIEDDPAQAIKLAQDIYPDLVMILTWSPDGISRGIALANALSGLLPDTGLLMTYYPPPGQWRTQTMLDNGRVLAHLVLPWAPNSGSTPELESAVSDQTFERFMIRILERIGTAEALAGIQHWQQSTKTR